MPRRSRIQVESSIYHIMLRGNEKKDIFCDEEDKQRITDTITRVRNDGDFKLYAYCIMDNHIHLCIKEGEDKTSRILKRIATSYAYYYNKKHDRVGHVFQDRFKSEGIMSDAQLLAVIRYIHNNPIKANIAKRLEDYIWSSYGIYTGKVKLIKEQEDCWRDITEVLGMFSGQTEKATQLFIRFSMEQSEDIFLDLDVTESQQEEHELGRVLQELLIKKGVSIDAVKKDKMILEDIVKELRFKHNASVRRTAELLNINRNTVQRIKNESKQNRPR